MFEATIIFGDNAAVVVYIISDRSVTREKILHQEEMSEEMVGSLPPLKVVSIVDFHCMTRLFLSKTFFEDQGKHQTDNICQGK